MADQGKQGKQEERSKRPTLIIVLCYVLVIEAWFYWQIGGLPHQAIQKGSEVAHSFQGIATATYFISILCLISAVGLFCMSKIGYYALLFATVIGICISLFAKANLGLLVPLLCMSGVAWVFRRQYRWFK